MYIIALLDVAEGFVGLRDTHQGRLLQSDIRTQSGLFSRVSTLFSSYLPHIPIVICLSAFNLYRESKPRPLDCKPDRDVTTAPPADPAMRGARRVKGLCLWEKEILALGPKTSPGRGPYGVFCRGGNLKLRH